MIFSMDLNSTGVLSSFKGWKFPFLICSCNPTEETPDTIISKICLHPNCKDKIIFCNECITNNLHDKLHSSHILKLKEFFEKCLNISSLYKEEKSSKPELPNEVMKLFKEKSDSVKTYKVVIDSEIGKIENLFASIIEEITKIFHERKSKLISHLNKTYETYAYSYDLFNMKVSEYIKNYEILTENSVQMNQAHLSECLTSIKTPTELKSFISKVNLKINQIQSVNKENLDNLTKFAYTLKKFQQTKPELKPLNIPKNSKYELLESLDVKSPLILAQRKLNFNNTDEFQKICAEIVHYADSFGDDVSQSIQNTLAEYEYFILENKKSEDFAVSINNYFSGTFNKPYLHYFHPNTKDLFLLNLPLHNSIYSPEDCIFHKITLDIPFNIPPNHTSINTPDGRLYLNGGKGSLDKMYEMNFEDRKLIQRKSMKQKRWDHAICFSKGYIFVFGGADRDENYKLTKKCDKYDMILDNWTEIASFSNEASDFSVCNFNDKYIYKFGGWNSISYINVIERYDIEFDQWIIINPPLKPLLGGFPECIQINERQIYVFGGFFVKGHDENFILEIDESEREESGYSVGLETIKLANKVAFPVRSQFKMAKSALVHNGVVYCIHKNKEQTSLLSFDGKHWKILNENLYKNFEVLE